MPSEPQQPCLLHTVPEQSHPFQIAMQQQQQPHQLNLKPSPRNTVLTTLQVLKLKDLSWQVLWTNWTHSLTNVRDLGQSVFTGIQLIKKMVNYPKLPNKLWWCRVLQELNPLSLRIKNASGTDANQQSIHFLWIMNKNSYII